jgi:hypothetical protein
MVLLTRRNRSERGVVALITAFLAIAMFAMAAIVIDYGHVRDVRRQDANAADAAALAAGNRLYLDNTLTPNFTEAVSSAKSYASVNFGTTEAQWTSCTDPNRLAYVPPGSTPCISFDYDGTDTLHRTTEVRVKMPTATVETNFAKLIGTSSVDVRAHAHVKLTPNPVAPCGLCVLGSGVHDLQNGDAIVENGDIYINGSVNVSSNGLVSTSGIISVQGTAGGSLANYDPDPLTGQAAISDPLSFLALPPDMTGLVNRSNPCTDGPGRYGSYNFDNSLCTLQPGLYVIAGPAGTEWKLTGNDSQELAGNGVTLYFTCGTQSVPAACSGHDGADLDASGNGFVSIKAPTSGPLKGLALAYDRGNTATMRLTGNGTSGMTGTIYMRSGTLQMNGNGLSAVNALVVVSDLTMNGTNATLHSSFNQANNVDFPPNALRLSQ